MEEKIPLYELQEPFRTENFAVHGVSIRGLSHEQEQMPLQDSFAAARLDNGWIVMAVADGVGSEPKAAEGASIAAAAVVNHLRRFRGFRIDDRSVERMLRAAYHAACAEIFAQAMRDQIPYKAYSTTLHTVLFSEGLLYIMHAGDGGVAILTEDGVFQKATSPMKGQDGESVIPLQGGPECWQFSVCRERAQSVAVVTDGVWDKMCPPVLEAYGDPCGVEKSIASFFLSPWARDWKEEPLLSIAEQEILLFRGDSAEAVPAFYNTLVSAIAQGAEQEEALNLVKTRVAPGNMPVRLLRGIKDDITVLTLVRFDPLPERTPVDQFAPTDWSAVHRWAETRLYQAQAAEPAPEAPEMAESEVGMDARAEQESGARETETENPEAEEPKSHVDDERARGEVGAGGSAL